MEILSEEEFIKAYEDSIQREFDQRDDRQLGWLFSDYLEWKYSEYLEEIAQELSGLVFHEDNYHRLVKISQVLHNEL